MGIFLQNGSLLWQGALTTLHLWILSTLISLIVGSILGILNSNRLWIPMLSPFIASVTFVLRAIPFYVQLLIVYFVLPAAIGVALSPATAGVIALGACSASYVYNIVRAGINSVPIEQWEACYVLGFSRINTLMYVVLPQMMRVMLPAIINELESILKSTSIISAIGVLELTRMGMNIVSREMNPIPIYCSIALVYLLFSGLMQLLVILIEKKFQNRAVH